MVIELKDPDATQFLLSLRKAYLKNRLYPAEYLTFYISAQMFSQYIKEVSARMKFVSNDLGWEPRTKYLLQSVRVKENIVLHLLEVNIVEGRRDWESM